MRGESGEFHGRWRGNKLFLRFCRIDIYDDDPEECPNYGVESAYVTRRGQEVFWYRSVEVPIIRSTSNCARSLKEAMTSSMTVAKRKIDVGR